VPFLLLVSSLAFAAETKEKQVQALNAILGELEHHYGMINYKQEEFGITYEMLRQKYTALIMTAQTRPEGEGVVPAVEREVLSREEFQQLMIALVGEFRDGHTNLSRASRRIFTLGFHPAALDGRLIVAGFDEVHRQKGSSEAEVQVGDEIVAVDGRPVADIARENMMYSMEATYDNRYAFGLKTAVKVPHAILPGKVKGAPVEVTFRREDPSSPEGYWTFKGRFHWVDHEDFSDFLDFLRPLDGFYKKGRGRYYYGAYGTHSHFREGLDKILRPGQLIDVGALVNMEFLKEKEKENEKGLLGKQLGQVKRLEAYVVNYEGSRIGVLRIPSYMPKSLAAVVNELKWIERVMTYFHEVTDGLIVDQLHNGGGFVGYVSQLLRFFADGQLSTGTIDMKLTDNLVSAHKMLDDPLDSSSPSSRNFARLYLERSYGIRLQQMYDAGQEWTGEMPFMNHGIDLTELGSGTAWSYDLEPYTNPIMILNDEGSASGGDFFPGILQADGLIVFGETSAGLGGPVYRSVDSMTRYELSFRCTYGFCRRSDGLPFENLGVVPDIRRPVRVRDLKDGFRGYARDVLDTFVSLIDGETVEELNSRLRESAQVRGPWVREESFKNIQMKLDVFNSMQTQAEDPTQLLGSWREMVTLIQRSRKKLGDQFVTAIEFELPKVLRQQDLLLSSLSNSRAVVERLEQLETLPKVREQAPEILKLIKEMKRALAKVPDAKFVGGCSALLTTHFDTKKD
jgi:C-terminal processing protease CtpA/Prc